ncbi:MAG: hypothetical protein KatS3mg103_1211 [Phycisphaerales bacterium]|nr:MAG: hypothetical protein KatS3mg103_1211 [Phycisphaerales bacterium]
MRTTITAAAVLATAGLALADSVDLTFTGVGAGRSFSVVANGTATNAFAGQLNFTMANGSGPAGGLLGGSLTTYCIDVLESVASGQQTYDLAELQDAPVTAGSITPAMGAAKATAIARMYTFAAGQQFGGSNDYAAAFQLAIWEVIGDLDNGLDIATGDFQVTSSINGGTSSILGDLLAAAVDATIAPFTRLGALTNEGYQDQLYSVAVPLPSAASLAAVGLVGMGLASRRRRA